MAIRCGHCGATHETIAEVRACSAGLPAVTAAPELPMEPPAAVATPTRELPTGGPPAGDEAWARWAGPDVLGRHVVLPPGASVPAPWRAAPEVLVDEAALADPAAAVEALREAAATASRRVIRLTLADWPRARHAAPLHELGPGFELLTDALHHLVWSNSVDGSDPAHPRWAPAERAVALGARDDGPADVVLPDGRAAWCDGGPLRWPFGLDVVVPAVALEQGSLAPLGPNRTSAALAPDQLAAVTHPGGAARVIAPAGSGKTRVLTERARLLLHGWGLPPGAVCLVAFNRRAQEEMRARTPDLAGLQVRTLNALALAIVNGDRPFAPRPTRRRTIDEPAVRDHLNDLVAVARRTNQDPLAPWIEALGQARLGLLDPDDVEAAFDGDVAGFAEVLPRYRARLAARGELDFDEQIVAAIELLLDDPDARVAAQRACRVLLVDELQDLTPAHLLLLRLVASPELSVFGVGDDDQTIYGYQGADPAWLIEFTRWFPGAGDHPLEVNYRCPPEVVAAADRLLRRNHRRVSKVIRPAKAPTSEAELVVVTAEDTTAGTVAAVEAGLARGVAPEEIAVLARVNVHLAPVQVALGLAGVPVRPAVGAEVLQRTSVRATLAWLRLAKDQWSSADVVEALRRPPRRLHPNVSKWAAEQRSTTDLRRLAARLHAERDAERVGELAADVDRLAALVRARPTLEVLDELFDGMGLAGAVASLDLTRHGTNRPAQADDLDVLRALARLEPDPAAFPTWLAEQLGRRRGDADPTAGVTLASVHRVKGQEWPLVIVHHADAAQFPHRLAEDVEEERRVFHVAITRAQDRAVVVATATPSPFVRECLEEPGPRDAVIAPPTRTAAPSRSARAAAEPEELSPTGQRAAQLLRALRTQLKGTKPAYTVFNDTTMRAIAAALPRDLAELARVPGIGPAKLEQYGDAILAVVEDARDA